MIEISVECIEKKNGSVMLNCNGSITGSGNDIRREMVGALILFDEVANGRVFCDAFEEFLEQKMEKKRKGAEGDD